ncbi:MAG TPA: ABC transporter permease, partial [Tistrella mobilis]|nr:ABC transporter permease [Tistrella mobilis]
MREGSPFTGVGTIALKEAADHMTGARLHLIMLLVLLTAAGALYGAIGTIRAGATDDTFLFLKLFTTARQPVPSFAGLLGFLLPLVAIALGFDAINAEHGRRTMSRLLAQPIYRDAILFGKFLGGLLVIAVAMVTLWLGTTGLGILFLGLPPTGAEVLRGLAYLVATIAYAGVWLALAMTLSTVIRSTATSALAALSIWLVLSVFWGMIAPVVASAISPVDP